MRVPKNTDWLLCSQSHIQNLPEKIKYLENMAKFDISSNVLKSISQNTLNALVNFKNSRYFK